MTLDNLVGISLEKVEPNSTSIARLLAAPRRNIADAKIMATSSENRFDAAYKAIMQLANTALQAKGFRTLTSKPGHHMTMVQALGQTLELDKQTVIVLDALRKQRNVADYSGDIIPESAARDCLMHAENVLQNVSRWLKVNRPELMK